MTSDESARTTRRVRVPGHRAVGLALAVAALGAVVGCGSTAMPSTSAPPGDGPRFESPAVPGQGPGAMPVRAPRRAPHGALGVADGAVPDGTTVFDDDVPGVAKLDPALLAALRQAAVMAENDGVAFTVDSGWRSTEYQQRLFDQAVSKYGSEDEAARWVASPSTSEHVKGHAIDLGSRGAKWLSEHGAAYGLCQIYRNEPWHFELRPEAADSGCPAMYADAAHDPRLHS